MSRRKLDEAVLIRTKNMHEECMKDPEYAAKWNALTSALFGLLADLPEDAVSAERETAPSLPSLAPKDSVKDNSQ